MIAIDLLPPDGRSEMEAVLAAIHELACESGVRTILEVAGWHERSDLLALLPQAGPYHVAMWIWLYFPTVFDIATMMESVENLSRWRKRKDLPRVEPRRAPEVLHELATGISRFLRCEEGRGERCTVEHYQRAGGIRDLLLVLEAWQTVDV